MNALFRTSCLLPTTTLVLLLEAATVLSAGMPAPMVNPVQGELEDMQTRLFAIRNTRDARALAESTREHLEAERWTEAVLTLQKLIEQHRGDILPAQMQDSTGNPSTYAFHTGAAAWATEQLRALPAQARLSYRKRFEKSSQNALRSARAAGSRRALIEVAARWPLSLAAQTALWTLGDLEFELGSLTDAQRAWKRASSWSELDRQELSAGAQRRLLLAEDWFESSALDPLAYDTAAGLHLTGPGEGRGPVPEYSAEPWRYRLPRSPFWNKQQAHSLFPIFFDEQVYVSTSWQTLAFDAYTGELIWESDEVPGWSSNKRAELVRGIDFEAVMLAPTVSGSIVISPTQVPFSRLGYATFQGIRITVPIPERRLFAYDRMTGDPLWNHMPPPLWEGDGGEYSHRMSLAGPPIATGSRVVVPCYVMQGRVDFHVACYDVSTGELLWSTQLISGQRALNMFGRHEREYCAPPVRIEGDRVVVLTQLGTVAALDLYTGTILWQSLYEQIPLPKTHTWSTQRRRQYWNNAAPIVADGAVLATPIDSEDLVAFDLEQGTVLWSYPNSLFNQDVPRGNSSEVNTLLGADDDSIYLGGGRLAAFHSPAGLASMSTHSRLTPTWSFSIDPADGSIRSPRSVLGRDDIVLPSRRGHVTVNKLTGLRRPRSSVPWNQEQAGAGIVGNLCLGDGMLFTANGDEVSGLFDWNILEVRARARIDADPSDIAAVLTFAQVREQHGAMLYQIGDARKALLRLEEAKGLLKSNLGHPTHAAQVAARLHTILRTAASAHESLAETATALRLLKSALALAPASDDVRDTLLQSEALLRGRDPIAWLETLAELERRCTTKSMPREAWTLVLRQEGPESDPVRGITQSDLEDLEPDLPVGLWVHLMRARAFGEAGDSIRELEELHACLARYGSYVLAPEKTTFDLASARIDEVLEISGRRVYTRFERRARSMLDEAGGSISARDMELIRRHYPHSDAAAEAGAALLKLAFEEGDANRVCRLVRESISDSIRPSSEDAEQLILLAESIGNAGNSAFQRGLLGAVARDFPNLLVPGSERPRTVVEHLEQLPLVQLKSQLPEQVAFEADLVSSGSLPGSYFSIGALPPGLIEDEPPPPLRHVFLREIEEQVFLEIHSAANPARSSLLVGLRGMHDARLFLSALTSDLVLLSNGYKLVAIDTETGNHAWDPWRAPRGWQLNELTVGGGVLVCMLQSEDGNYRAQAYDVHGGRELWRINLPKNLTWRAPILEENRAVFLTQSHTWQSDAEARVVDLYRGVTLSTIDLGDKLSADTYESAFVRDGVLVLAGFHMASISERNRVVGYDLERGHELWSYALSDGHEIDMMVAHGTSTYLVVSSADNGIGGSIMQLETRLGAVRPVMQLQLEDRILVPRRSNASGPGPLQLGAPYLFFYSAHSGRATTPITAVHLPFGKRWVCSLRIPFDELYDVGMSFPAVSADIIAIAFTTKTANYLAGDTYLTLIDREGGMKRGDYVLPRSLGHADDLELVGLGDALCIISHNGKNGFPMEIWETRR